MGVPVFVIGLTFFQHTRNVRDGMTHYQQTPACERQRQSFDFKAWSESDAGFNLCSVSESEAYLMIIKGSTGAYGFVSSCLDGAVIWFASFA